MPLTQPADDGAPVPWSVGFAGHLASHPIGAFPAAVLTRGQMVLADTLSAIAAGARQPEVARLTARFADPGGVATIIASGGARARPDDAAFLNAIAGTAAEMDEGHYGAGGHPGIHVVPAALATAEALGASGEVLLDAIIMGYEAASRIGLGTRLRPSVHSHGTWGVVGAAAATARLRGFDGAMAFRAVTIAASLATATSRTSPLAGATVRHVYAGIATRNGMLACDLAETGFEGQADAFDIAFGQVLGDGFDPAFASAPWGDAWTIERNYFKFAASCKDTQGSLQALSDLAARLAPGALRADRIDAIRVETFADAAALAEPMPRTTIAARFSIPFVLATRIVRGDAGVDDFGPEARSDARITDLASRIEVVEDPAMTAKCPQSHTRMHLAFRDGTCASAEVEGSLGDFDKPLDPGLLAGKFAALTAGVWDPGERIRDRCMAIAGSGDIRALTALLG